MRDGDNNTEVLVQYFKLVTLHDRPPLYDTPHPPYHADDVTWHHVTSLVWCSLTPIMFLDPLFCGCIFFFLSVTCHVLRKFPSTHTHPLISIHEFFEALQVIIFWVRVIHKMLNVNWEKIHSIILCVTCHGLRNFPWLIHIPSKSVMNCWKPYELLFSELESLIKC